MGDPPRGTFNADPHSPPSADVRADGSNHAAARNWHHRRHPTCHGPVVVHVRCRMGSAHSTVTLGRACEHGPPDAGYLVFFAAVALLVGTSLESAATFGFFGCLGLRTSRPPLFFGIGSPCTAMDPV